MPKEFPVLQRKFLYPKRKVKFNFKLIFLNYYLIVKLGKKSVLTPKEEELHSNIVSRKRKAQSAMEDVSSQLKKIKITK
jgi:hypothetical protein